MSGVRLLTRNGKDWTGRFPTIVDAAAGLKACSCLIGGEAVCCDENGLAVFERLRLKPSGKHVFLYAFDLLELDEAEAEPVVGKIFPVFYRAGGVHPLGEGGRPGSGRSASMLSPRRLIRRPPSARVAISAFTSGCSLMPILPMITAPCSSMIAAYCAARSQAAHACRSISRPPASAIAYCACTERHNASPASPSDGGGSGRVTTTPTGETSESGGFLAYLALRENFSTNKMASKCLI